MKTFHEHLLDVAQEQGVNTKLWEHNASLNIVANLAEIANKRYTTAAIKEHLSRAAENAARFRDLEDDNTRDLYESITNIDIELP